jgi:hypothetical protein
LRENKTFRLKQATVNQEIETGEIDANHLDYYKVKRTAGNRNQTTAQAEEAVTTAIEEAQSQNARSCKRK